MEKDDCLAGVGREKTVHAQRGKREPAVAPVQPGKNPIQALSRNADFPPRGMESDDMKDLCQCFAPCSIFFSIFPFSMGFSGMQCF
jgi:hypothetical protein